MFNKLSLFAFWILCVYVPVEAAVTDHDVINKIKSSSEYTRARSYDRYAMTQSYVALPDSLKNLVKHLQDKKYSSINTYIDEAMIRHRQKPDDYQLERIISTAIIVLTEPKYISLDMIDEWVAKTPRHYFPYLIKSSFYINSGYSARGAKYASETSEYKLKEMKRFHEVGIDALNKCIELNPQFEFAYSNLIRYLRASSGTEEAAREAYGRGLALNPYSFEVRWAYLDYNRPEWHGKRSTEKMEEIIGALGKEKNKNVGVEAIKGRVLALRGDDYQKIWSKSLDDKDFVKAIESYDQALSYGDLYYYHYRKAVLLFSFRDYEEALRHFKRAIEISPYNEEAHKNYIWAMEASGALQPFWAKDL